MDSAHKIITCMQQAAISCELPVPSASAVAHIIGISLQPAIAQLFNVTDEKVVDRLVEAYKHHYLSVDTTPCPLFDGVQPMLGQLATHTQLAVATGKARRGLERAWKGTDTAKYFDHSICADESESKPSPAMLRTLLERTGLSAQDAVMVGDTSYDMQMAQALGMDRVAVSYGVHTPELLQQFTPSALVDDISELADFLCAGYR